MSLIYVERAVSELPYTQSVLQNFPGARVIYIDDIRTLIKQHKKVTFAKEQQPLVLAKQRGRFLEKCPGTKEHICCNYYTLNTAVGCPYDCTYCFLQSYSNNPYYTIYTNNEDMLAEIRHKVRGKIRLGTGEFTDSLAMEMYTQFVYTYAPQICAISPDITLELKTKSAPLNLNLAGEKNPGLQKQLVWAFSVNPQSIIDSDEHRAAPLAARIQAAKTAVQQGYRTALHFDPIIYSPNWQAEYQTVLDLIKQNIPYEKFICGIKRFYEDTNFEYFFENNRNEYEMLINDYINKNELKEYVNIVDMYLGSDTKNYTIVVSALLMGNFGIKLLMNENITNNYSIISPFDYKKNKYIFGPKIFILELLWHEISHLTINDMTKSYIISLI